MSPLIKNASIVMAGLILSSGTTLFMLMTASESYIARIAVAQTEAAAKAQPEKPWDFWTIEMENLSNDLKEEKALLKQKEESLAQRESRLAVERIELEKTRKQLEKMRVEIDARLTEITEGEAANLKKLALTYASMTPKTALPIYKEMDDTTLAKLIYLMKPEVVKAIFEEMSKQSAGDPQMAKRVAALSEKLRLIKNTK